MKTELEIVEVGSELVNVRGKFDPKSGVKRGLKTRHISMMALAGIIGPGVFIGMGSALNAGGPVGLITGFAIVGILVMIMMTCIGEMNAMFDFNFNTHISRWIDPALGAAVGWNYVFLWICNIIAEYVSATSVLSFYSTKVPMYGYYLIMWAFFSVYQMFGVDVFGEVEYILAFVKILFVSGFYLFAIIYAAGGIPGHSPGNPFKDYPLAGGFKGIANSFVYAGVFYTGIESLSVAFLEAKNVKKSVKKAVNQSVFRIFYIYFGISICYGITVPYNDPGLSTSNQLMKSPMTIALVEAGWKNAGYYVTTIVFITCFSSINSAVYFASRALLKLSVDGYAPKIFTKVSKRGVPWVAVHCTHLFGFLSLLAMDSSSSIAYNYIVNLAGISAFMVWTAIVYAQYRFRKGWIKQGNSTEDLYYKSPFYPYTNYCAMTLGVILCLVQGWAVFVPFNAGEFVDYYILLPIFFILWAIYKFALKSKWVKYEDMDFISDRNADFEVDDVEQCEASSGEKIIEEEHMNKKQSILSNIWNSI